MDKPQLPSQTPDLIAAAITFVGINLMWVFFVIWMIYGMFPVLMLALVLNHFIDRLDARLG